MSNVRDNYNKVFNELSEIKHVGPRFKKCMSSSFASDKSLQSLF